MQWKGETYLEDGLHRALRSALQGRTVIHVRVLDLDAASPQQAAPQSQQAQASVPLAQGPTTETIPAQPPVPQPQSSRFGRR